MTRLMTVSGHSRWSTRLAIAAFAALLWVATFGAMSASAAPGNGPKGGDSPPAASDSARGGSTNPGNGLPGSVRWR